MSSALRNVLFDFYSWMSRRSAQRRHRQPRLVKGSLARAFRGRALDEAIRSTSLGADELTNILQGAGILAAISAGFRIARLRAHLRKPIERLTTAHNDVIARRARVELESSAGPAADLHLQEAEWRRRNERRLRIHSGWTPAIDPRQLLAAEVLVLVAEVYLWYQLINVEISDDVAAWSPERLAAYLFAMVVPLAGVLSARVSGAIIAVFFLAPAQGDARRRQWCGLGFAAVLVSAVCTVTVYLIGWRYAESQTFDTVSLPGLWLGGLFALVTLLLTSARGFLLPPFERAQQQADQELLRSRRRRADAERALQEAHAAWTSAAVAAHLAFMEVLQEVENVLRTAELMVFETRTARPEHADHAPLRGVGSLAAADQVVLDWRFDLPLPQVLVRDLDAAWMVLRRESPPDSMWDGYLDTLTVRLSTLDQVLLAERTRAGGA